MAPGSSVSGMARRGSGVPVGEGVVGRAERAAARRARGSAANAASVRARAASRVTKALKASMAEAIWPRCVIARGGRSVVDLELARLLAAGGLELAEVGERGEEPV